MMVLLLQKKLMMQFDLVLDCVGRSWERSWSIALPGAKPECVTLWRSLVRHLNGRGRNL